MNDWDSFDPVGPPVAPAAAPAAAPTAATVTAPPPAPGYRANGSQVQWYDPTGGMFPEGTNMNTPDAQAKLAAWQKQLVSPAATNTAWDKFDPVGPTPPPAPAPDDSGHATEAPTDSTIGNAYNFTRTALTKATAGIVGIPRAIEDAGTWMDKHVADLSFGPQLPAAPTGQQAEDFLFNHTAPEYMPSSTLGQYGMDAATFAAPALIGGPSTIIPNLIRGGVTGAIAHGLNENVPGFGIAAPLATVLGEVLFHQGLGAIRPSLASGANAKAGQIASEMGVPTGTTNPALPNLRLTVGQLHNDPRWLALDAERESPAAAAEARAGNEAIIHRTLDNIAGGPGGADAATEQAGIVNQNERKAWQDQDSAWKQVGNASFNIKPLKRNIEAYVKQLKTTRPRSAASLPLADVNGMLALPDTVPLETLQDFRSSLGSTASKAGLTGDNLAAMLAGRGDKGIGGLLENHLNEPRNLLSKDPAVMQRYRAAIAATKKYYDVFGNDNKAGAQIDKLVDEKIAPEATMTRFLPPGSEGAGRAALSRLKIASGPGKGLNPVRNYLTGKLKDSISNGADAFAKVLKDYDYAFKDTDVFTPAQQATIKDAADAMEQINRVARAGSETGSVTFERLKGGNFARELYGATMAKVLPLGVRIAGAGLGNTLTRAIGWEGGEEIAGQLTGAEAAGDMLKEAMQTARERVFEVLDKARRDPALARELQMKATAANLAVAPRVRGMLKSFGLSTAEVLPKAAGADPASQGGE
jgi:hypothetical protein